MAPRVHQGVQGLLHGPNSSPESSEERVGGIGGGFAPDAAGGGVSGGGTESPRGVGGQTAPDAAAAVNVVVAGTGGRGSVAFPKKRIPIAQEPAPAAGGVHARQKAVLLPLLVVLWRRWQQRRRLGRRGGPSHLRYLGGHRGRSRSRVCRYPLRRGRWRVERIVPRQVRWTTAAATAAAGRTRAARFSMLLEVLELLVEGFLQAAEGVSPGLLVCGRLGWLVLRVVLRVVGPQLQSKRWWTGNRQNTRPSNVWERGDQKAGRAKYGCQRQNLAELDRHQRMARPPRPRGSHHR